MKPTGIIRSGWWVAVAAVAVSILVTIVVLRESFESRASRGDDPIATEPSLLDGNELVRPMARDGLKALDSPATLSPDEVDRINQEERGKLLVQSDRVVGVEIGGEARAYPLRLLQWHEVVNDTLGGRSIAVTVSPLSGGIAVWDRRVGDDEIHLAVSGYLVNSNTLLYDRRAPGETSSLWHQLTGKAVAGPAVGQRLEPLPAALQTWGRWRVDHPRTTVMAPDEDSKQLYRRDPYHSYRGSDLLRFPVDPLPPEGILARKDLVAVVTHAGWSTAFALPYLEMAVGETRGSWATLLGEDVFVIDFDAEAETFAIAPRDEGVADPPVRFASWFEWYALDPTVVPLP